MIKDIVIKDLQIIINLIINKIIKNYLFKLE